MRSLNVAIGRCSCRRRGAVVVSIVVAVEVAECSVAAADVTFVATVEVGVAALSLWPRLLGLSLIALLLVFMSAVALAVTEAEDVAVGIVVCSC